MSRAFVNEDPAGKERSDEPGAATVLSKLGLSPSRFRLWIQSGGFDEEARRRRRILPGRTANRQNHTPPRGEDGSGPQPGRSTGSRIFDFQPFGGWERKWEIMALSCDCRPAPASVTERQDLAARTAGSED